ncbi:hypothetical protein A2U01_0111704, partial [Trifolium medium]|nr:hypothetical protein [Trifolium medium]
VKMKLEELVEVVSGGGGE